MYMYQKKGQVICYMIPSEFNFQFDKLIFYDFFFLKPWKQL